MAACSTCPGRMFNSFQALHQHKIASRGHYYCKNCALDFLDHNSLFDHATNAHATTCVGCRRMFTSEGGVSRHFLDSPKHPKCRLCKLGFRSPADLAAHKTVVHGSMRNPRRRRSHRSFSPFTSTTGSLTPSPTLHHHSPASSATEEITDIDEMLRRLPSSSHCNKEENKNEAPRGPLYSISDTLVGSFPSHSTADADRDNQLDAQVASGSVAIKTTSPHLSESPVPVPARLDVPAESNDDYEDDNSPRDELSMFVGMNIDLSSPLLEATVPLPSDSGSDISGDGGDLYPRYAINRTRSRSSSPHVNREFEQRFDRYSPTSSTRCRIASPTPTYSKVTDTMRADWRARCAAAAARSPSPRRLASPPGIDIARASLYSSRLPTISDELEVEEEAELDDREALLPLLPNPPSDWQPLVRPAGRRTRRLSLSPTLFSIPEAAHIYDPEVSSPEDAAGSDSESSQGILEHQAEDFLYESLSENERCQTPMTYLTAEDFEFEIEEDVRSYGGEETYLERNTDCELPELLVEDLTKQADDKCSPSTMGSDSEQFDDPFELHPSASNTPVSATFPKRPRAWSVSVPESDARFLFPVIPKFETMSGTRDVIDSLKLRSGIDACQAQTGTAEEIDEAALAADEPPPTIIEEDLFSEPDEILQPIPPETLGAEPVGGSPEAQFAEEGHPLRDLISLNTLPSSTKSRRESQGSPSNRPSSSPTRVDTRTKTYGVESNEGECSSFQYKTPLHCRLCKADPCQEVTATFCGHIFCHGCITREVMATSKCPACNAPTLLYCLFKLDLSS